MILHFWLHVVNTSCLPYKRNVDFKFQFDSSATQSRCSSEYLKLVPLVWKGFQIKIQTLFLVHRITLEVLIWVFDGTNSCLPSNFDSIWNILLCSSVQIWHCFSESRTLETLVWQRVPFGVFFSILALLEN